MSAVLPRLPKGARIALIRLRSLGDCVLTTPALHLLHNARPDLEIAVVVEDRFAPIFAGNPDVSAVLPPQIAQIARWRPELVLNLHGGTKSIQLALASRARFRAGFAHLRFQPLYNIRIPRAQEILGEERTVHTAEHIASAMFYLGVPRQPIPRARLSATARPGLCPYAVIHPVASAADKTWPAENFLALAHHVEERLGLEPIFIAGPGEDLAAFQSYRCISGAPLEEIKALLAGAAFFAGNDSGPAHMAAAFGLPVVVFFGNSNPAIWHPWQTASAVLAAPQGIRAVSVDEAISAIAKLPVVAVPSR